MKHLPGRAHPLALAAALALSIGPPASARQDPMQLPPLLDIAVTRGAVVGGEVAHVVVAGETVAELAASYGVDAKVLTSENGLRPGASLQPGQSLRIPSLHTIPPGTHDGIVVNIPQRHLFYFSGGALAGHYPVAVGRGDWRTPTGGFHIATKETDPSWEVPKSIQAEMRRSGKPVMTSVPAGPDNPLGKYWLGFDRTGVGIHGTNSPNSIYRSATHGCIRMRAESIEDLFGKVEVNTVVTVIYQPVLLGIDGDGIYLEAHPDVYKKGGDPVAVVQRLVAEAGVRDRIVWETVKQVLAKREGIARRIDVGSGGSGSVTRNQGRPFTVKRTAVTATTR